MNYKILFLIILSLSFLVNFFVEFLKLNSIKRPTPDSLKDIYDEQTYEKWKSYKYECIRFSFVEDIVNFLPLFLMVIFDFYPYISNLIGNNLPLNILVIVSIYLGISILLELPFSAYKDFHIEAKYGFNKTTVSTFIKDNIITTLLTFIITLAPIYFYVYLFNALKEYSLIISIVSLFIVFMLINFLFPYLAKIFNKFTPLEDGELKTKLINLGNKCGYSFSNIYVIDASKRSTRDNAYFTGFGKTKRIVLYDTLLGKYTNDEIVSIFAHELGHAIHKDTLKNFPNFVLSAIAIVLGFYFLTIHQEFFFDFGFSDVNYGFAFIIFSGCFDLINFFYGIITNLFSRKHEFAADKNAVILGYGDELIASLKKISRNSFSYLNINPLLQFMTGSHPTLSERIDNINKEKQKLIVKK